MAPAATEPVRPLSGAADGADAVVDEHRRRALVRMK